MKAEVTTFFDSGKSCTACYVIADPKHKVCAIIDSYVGLDLFHGRITYEGADAVIKFIKSKGYKCNYVCETHAHADHITAAPYLKKALGCKSGIGENITAVQKTFNKVLGLSVAEDGSQFDKLWADGEKFDIGDLTVTCLSTPGHTPACTTYYIEDDCVFTGDTIFMPDMGTARCDFPKGSIETIWDSIQKVLSLPDNVRVFVGHDYKPGRDEYAWESTIAEEKKSNKHVKTGTKKDEFVKMRSDRDKTLDTPRWIIPAVQANIQAGELLKDKNGNPYLKINVGVF